MPDSLPEPAMDTAGLMAAGRTCVALQFAGNQGVLQAEMVLESQGLRRDCTLSKCQEAFDNVGSV